MAENIRHTFEKEWKDDPRNAHLLDTYTIDYISKDFVIVPIHINTEQLDELPKDVLDSLKEGLVVLEEHLWEVASGEGQTRLSEIGEWLLARVKSSLEEKPGGEWVYSLQRLALASRQLARPVAEIQAIKTAWQVSPGDAPPTKKPAAAKPAPLNPLGKKMGFTLHPTSILGLQAVLATGLAILAATLLKMDQPNLVFWTAFVVIAGSTGESLRRITMRVAGVIAGTAIGVALAVILPDHLTLVVLVVTMCFFPARCTTMQGDSIRVVKTKADHLDLVYLHRWAKELAVEDLLERALFEASV